MAGHEIVTILWLYQPSYSRGRHYSGLKQ